MSFVWNKRYETGVAIIDHQHQEIFLHTNRLLAATEMECRTEESLQMMEFLGNYVVQHFNMEERTMLGEGYPDYDAHVAEHLSFIEEYGRLLTLVKERNTNVTAVIIQRKVCDWLITHIMHTDIAMAVWLKKSEQQKAA